MAPVSVELYLPAVKLVYEGVFREPPALAVVPVRAERKAINDPHAVLLEGWLALYPQDPHNPDDGWVMRVQPTGNPHTARRDCFAQEEGRVYQRGTFPDVMILAVNYQSWLLCCMALDRAMDEIGEFNRGLRGLHAPGGR